MILDKSGGMKLYKTNKCYKCVSAIEILLISYLSILLEMSDVLPEAMLDVSLGTKLSFFNANNNSSRSSSLLSSAVVDGINTGGVT